MDDYHAIGWISGHLGLTLAYTGGERGWIGESQSIFLELEEIGTLGWWLSLSIRDGVTQTLKYLQANPWLREACS